MMSEIQFKHVASGVSVTANEEYLGIFETEKDALYYLFLNDYIENLFIERF